MNPVVAQYVLDLSVLNLPALNGYVLDLDYGEQVIREYKDLIWLVLTLMSTLIVIYGILLPQRNNARQRKQEATLSLIDRWTAQHIPQTLVAYQTEVFRQALPRSVTSEHKTHLFSFFHTVALLIREQKVEEALLRKSQICLGFLCFYGTLLNEQPDFLQRPTYYGKAFHDLYRQWRGVAKRYKGMQLEFSSMAEGATPTLDAKQLMPSAGADVPASEGKKPPLYVVPHH
jgi:hypothetical protein